MLCAAQVPGWMVPQNAQAAQKHIDNAFKQFLSTTLRSALKEGDLKKPTSSARVHQLLEQGRSSIAVY